MTELRCGTWLGNSNDCRTAIVAWTRGRWNMLDAVFAKLVSTLSWESLMPADCDSSADDGVTSAFSAEYLKALITVIGVLFNRTASGGQCASVARLSAFSMYVGEVAVNFISQINFRFWSSYVSWWKIFRPFDRWNQWQYDWRTIYCWLRNLRSFSRCSRFRTIIRQLDAVSWFRCLSMRGDMYDFRIALFVKTTYCRYRSFSENEMFGGYRYDCSSSSVSLDHRTTFAGLRGYR